MTRHECQKLVEKLTGMFDFDYIHFSLLEYNSKPELADSDEPVLKMMCDTVRNDTKTIVAGGIHTVEKMKDALNYMDIVGLGRPPLVDPMIASKIVNGHEDQIYFELNDESVKKAHLTPGLFELLANIPEFKMPGTEYLKTISTLDLDDSVTHY